VNRRALPALLLALGLGAGGLAGAAPALADPATAAQARAEAAAAADAAREATAQVAAARDAYARQQRSVASAVSASVGTQVEAERAQTAARALRARTTQRVRSIYIDGGVSTDAGHGLALLTSLTRGEDLTVALAGMSAARRLDDAADGAAQEQVSRSRDAAEAAGGGAVAAVAQLREVAVRVEVMGEALDAAQQRLESLTATASRLQAAEDAAAALAAAQAQAAALNAAAAGTAAGVHARAVAADYTDLYVRAAATCAGMRPALLAAVGQVESGHGVDVGPSSAGALGPMQFMPATFAAYGVDGDGDGDEDVQDPADAVFTAANYLCANGGGKGREGEAGALFRYNHADWYVAMVQRIADELAAGGLGAGA
jgi:soluble lytic murein transglycosylase-like protein